ncbi:MAG TPA: Maf family protein [Pirellulales bacterium]|nr:Maf family protein [Pirellulales bacterium]
MSAAAPLILASSSPRRRELMTEEGYTFRVMPPHDDAEPFDPDEPPGAIVARLATAKAADVASRVERGIVIGCDTVAECEGHILNKPNDIDDARRMLRLLSGRQHHVYSGLCVWPVPGNSAEVGVARTTLQMAELSTAAIDEYLATGLWQGKAGAFGLQDRLEWLAIVEGSESNVVGLPLELLAEMLARVTR